MRDVRRRANRPDVGTCLRHASHTPDNQGVVTRLHHGAALRPDRPTCFRGCIEGTPRFRLLCSILRRGRDESRPYTTDGNFPFSILNFQLQQRAAAGRPFVVTFRGSLPGWRAGRRAPSVCRRGLCRTRRARSRGARRYGLRARSPSSASRASCRGCRPS